MHLFDLALIIAFLTTLVALVVILVNLLRGRFAAAKTQAVRLAIGLSIYIAIVAITGALAPQTVLTMGQARCYDEMCFAATSATQAKSLGTPSNKMSAHGKFVVVSITITNEGHSRAERESLASVELIDSHGNRFAPSLEGQNAYESVHGTQPPLTSRIDPQETITTTQVFDVPTDSSDLAVHFGHAPGPDLLVIGDDECLLHKPTVVELPELK